MLFTSEDGVSWKHEESALQKPPYLLWDLFHLSNPVLNARDGHYYALARIVREEGSVVLCRSPSIEGPYEQGPRLGRSIRNFHLFDVGDGEMYVLFSMTGDRPERILLGSVDRPASSANWTDWKLLPGPRILRPEYWYEHGNAEVTTSKPGLAESRHRVSDPRILLDERDSSDNATRISGLIFYSVQGERGIAAARVSIDLDSYRNVTSYRDHANIRPDVLGSTSLARNDEISNNKTTKVTPLLVTGVGRTGTTSGCTLLRNVGIMVSHDNDVDCGPYPGPDGAVSWLDAFGYSTRRYEHVIHMVRDPLKTINSRIVKCNLKWLIRQTGPHERYSLRNDTCATLATKHWVRRNSFVEAHASWRTRAELLFSEPLSAWELCMAARFGDRCPELSFVRSKMEGVPSDLNSLYAGATASELQKKNKVKPSSNRTGHDSWASLAVAVGKENFKYIRIARTMARRYGYDASSDDDYAPCGYYCKFMGNGTEKDEEKGTDWDCFIADSM